MSFFPTKTASTRGTIKCYKCRSPHLPKEGKWVTGGREQVFVCKDCRPTNSMDGSSDGKVRASHSESTT